MIIVNPYTFSAPVGVTEYAYDTFLRADNTVLNNAESGEAYSYTNSADGAGQVGIASNMAKPDPTSSYGSAIMHVGYFDVADTNYTGDGYLEFVVSSTNANLASETLRAYFRVKSTGFDNDSWLLQSGNGATLTIGRFVAGAYANIINVSNAHVKGDRIGVLFSGTSVQLYKNRVAVGSPGTGPSNGLTEKRIGLGIYDAAGSRRTGRIDEIRLYSGVPT